MIFDGKPTTAITTAEIEALVTDHVAEDQYLDFKARPYLATDEGTTELIKDVCAFANAAGGYLIIGIGEDGQGRANGFVNVADAESVRRSIIDRCFARIEPRLPTFEARVFSVNDRNIVVCHVPDSPLKPHLSQPDREHHAFWRRYVDGNKLMTYSEIRDAIQGDAVQREVALLRQELARQRVRETVDREMANDIDEAGLLRLGSLEAFAHHAQRIFLKQVGDRPYFRLTATPLPHNGHDLRTQRDAIAGLLMNPPKFRAHGWDMNIDDVATSPRQTVAGLQIGAVDYRHIRMYWDGHLEFWTPADGESISWAMDKDKKIPVSDRSFNPLAIIEWVASFVQLARHVWTATGVSGEAEFRLSLHRVRGRRIPPYADNTYGRMLGIPEMEGDSTIGAFQEDDFHVEPTREQIANLPGKVAFNLISEMYYRLGYRREHIPYFDAQDQYVEVK